MLCNVFLIYIFFKPPGGVSACAQWLSLTYSNGPTKLYPLASFLPPEDAPSPVGSLSSTQHETSNRLQKPLGVYDTCSGATEPLRVHDTCSGATDSQHENKVPSTMEVPGAIAPTTHQKQTKNSLMNDDNANNKEIKMNKRINAYKIEVN